MKIKLFALNATREFGEEVANHLGLPLCDHEEWCFEDGECYIAPKTALKENVRGHDVFVIQSVYTDQNENINQKMMKLFIFLGALHDASAKRITVISPYYPYARQDRKTASRAPITTKYVARLFKSMWVDRILTLDVHNPTAIQNANEVPCDLLEARNLFAAFSKKLIEQSGAGVVVLSPDIGGLGRAATFQGVLSRSLKMSVDLACMYKTHHGTEIKGHDVMVTGGSGDVAGKSVIIYDDMISSGKTVLECCEVIKRKNAKEVLAVCASHGLFVGRANEYLDNPFLKNIVVTDTINPFRITNPNVRDKLNVIKTTGLFAEAIKRIAGDESISDLIANS